MTNRNSREVVAGLLRRASRVLAVTHMHADGDAIGSLAASAHIVQALGHEARLYCSSRVPEHLAWLPLPAPVVGSLAELGGWEPDLLLVLDCADPGRAGEEMRACLAACDAREDCPTVCVDHHMGNPLFAAFNWVDPDYAATGAMLGDLAGDLGIPPRGALGEALYLALAADTGTFSFSNTTPQALRLAADIVEQGLDLASFTARYENNWPLNRMHLWGQLMREVRLECGGRIAVSVVTVDHLSRFGTPKSDLENFASWLRRLAGVQVVVFCRTSIYGSKLSLRSMGDVDVRAIAARFGGGGHKGAAGLVMPCEPEEAAAMVLEAVRQDLGCA